ncbi:hypothetical protein BD414DRAFT_474353 [Trametes punicea]|nr:hypothetical protein BD414DRAFT_474353 [Trametes punicea]
MRRVRGTHLTVAMPGQRKQLADGLNYAHIGLPSLPRCAESRPWIVRRLWRRPTSG